MNQLNFLDPETKDVSWSVVILEPDEIQQIVGGNPATIDLDPDNDDTPMLTVACEEDSERLQEVLSSNDSESIMKYLNNEQPPFPAHLEGRTRQEYERAVKAPPARTVMKDVELYKANAVNISPGSLIGSETPDRILLSLVASDDQYEFCYEVNTMAKADRIIELLISARNRLWPHGRIEL